MLDLRRAGPARPPRVRGAAPVQNPAWSHECRPASAATCAAGRFRLASARDAIHRRVSLRMRAPAERPAERLRATLRLVRVRARTTPDGVASETAVPRVTHDVTAGIHHECFRGQQRFDFSEQEEPLPATGDQARRRRVQDERRAFDLRDERRDTGLSRGQLGLGERGARGLRFGGAACAIPATTNSWTALTQAEEAWGRDARACARPRRAARSGGGAGLRGSGRARR